MAKLRIPTLDCKRCGHSWHPRREELPTVCPKCHSPYWNRELENGRKTA